MNRTVAANVRALRSARGMSLGELASISGVGKTTLSRIESAHGNPTIETLFTLADALGVPFGALTAADQTPVEHIRAAELPQFGGSVDAKLFTQIPRGALVEALEVVFPAGRTHRSGAHPRGVVEHLLLTAGRLRAGPTDESTEIEVGDVLHFPADVDHEYEPLGDEDAKAIVLMSYPGRTERG